MKPFPFPARTLAGLAAALLMSAAPAAGQPAPASAPVFASVPASAPPFMDPNAPQAGDLSQSPPPAVSARAWLVLDVNSGQMLASSNPDMKIEPASLTKIMTAYVVFNALDEKRITLDQEVPVSQRAWRTGGSRMFIQPRMPVTVDQLNQGLIVQSGNDAAVALAEAVTGSVEAFVTRMNEQAERLGMRDTHYMNVDGLPDPGHTTTARDLAVIASRLITDHPGQYHYYKQREFTYNKIKQANRNRLLWADPSVDGMKTGHTDAAGYCLISTALRGDRRVLAVLLGANSEATRAEESLKLLNWGFQNFDLVTLYGQNQPGIAARVWEGKEKTARLGPAQPVQLAVPRGKAAGIKPVARHAEPLMAPLTKGQNVGTMQFTLDGKVLRAVPLVAQEDVARAGFFGRMADTVRRWFQ
jgi:D-alanyl-D-alanine carboxypeptidase (penicillin-binding protein 5/6)